MCCSRRWSIPKEAQPNTNFAGAKFTIGKSTDPSAVRNCVRDAPGDQVRSAALNLHRRPFTQLVFSDAGAGNFYDTTSYRNVDKGQCWAVEYTMHSTNLGNYPPDQHVKAFDRAKIAAELEAMARSFELRSHERGTTTTGLGLAQPGGGGGGGGGGGAGGGGAGGGGGLFGPMHDARSKSIKLQHLLLRGERLRVALAQEGPAVPRRTTGTAQVKVHLAVFADIKTEMHFARRVALFHGQAR